MKTQIFLIAAMGFSANWSFAQSSEIDRYLSINPGDINIEYSGIQAYDVTLKWQNLDAISGHKINCNGVRATYLVGLENDYAGWRNVSLAQLEDFHQEKFEGTDLLSFDDFSYKVMDTAFLSEEFYAGIPAEQRDLARWLVSDAVQMQGLACYVFDSLRYNEEFIPKLLDHYDIKFENWVTFSNQYQKLIWSGICRHNDEICAIVKFESLFNPVEINNDQVAVQGRALYYGEMWISLTDKQVEYASMVEDVVMELTGSIVPDPRLIDLQREIVFNKVN